MKTSSEDLLALIRAIKNKVRRPLRVMEFCGTHTVSIAKSGLRGLLSPELELVSGPGCPVCVTAQRDLDAMIAFARMKDVIIATFGDLLRVPGSETTLEKERARGADVRVIYSPQDALQIAHNNTHKNIVFPGVGFETTAPAVALAVRQARESGLKNFFLYSSLKKTPPVMHALLSGDIDIDGLLLPGHVSTIIGRRVQEFVSREYGLPAAITGFSEMDIVYSLASLVLMINKGKADVLNCYRRAVREEGNRIAVNLMEETFVAFPAEWRGFGKVPESGMTLRQEYSGFDADRYYGPQVTTSGEEAFTGCRCGEVLRGKIVPTACAYFAHDCMPEKPLGPCMVSSEGACAAYYRYNRRRGDENEPNCPGAW
jgi:hydrogenase expression/formation protein HypD